MSTTKLKRDVTIFRRIRTKRVDMFPLSSTEWSISISLPIQSCAVWESFNEPCFVRGLRTIFHSSGNSNEGGGSESNSSSNNVVIHIKHMTRYPVYTWSNSEPIEILSHCSLSVCLYNCKRLSPRLVTQLLVMHTTRPLYFLPVVSSQTSESHQRVLLRCGLDQEVITLS